MLSKTWKSVLVGLGALTVWIAVRAILNFFEIKFTEYSYYVFWALAMLVFYYCLQGSAQTLFGDAE